MKTNEKLIQLLKEQIDIENEHIKSIAELEKKCDNAVARLLLLEMRFDSQKHAGILDGILKVLAGVPPSKTLWEYRVESYVDQLAVKKEFEEHISREDEVVEHIGEDEKKHHKILETIVKNAYKIK